PMYTVARMDASDVNRAHWDALAQVHGQDGYYDAESLIAGRFRLGDVESQAVGEVAGLDILHLQCHLGFDSIALGRMWGRIVWAGLLGRVTGAGVRAGRGVRRVGGVRRGGFDGVAGLAARALRRRLLDDRGAVLDCGHRVLDAVRGVRTATRRTTRARRDPSAD